jgi:CRP/FNR family cyclic AMP-dependent transcriptional regulator
MARSLTRLSHDRRAEALASVPLFRRCSPDELRRVGGLATELDLATGTVVCRQGTPGHEACIVVEGEAEVAIDEEVVATIGPGGFFGELALLDGGPRVATVTATKPLHLLVLNRQEFRAMVEQAPTVAWNLLEGIGSRLRQVETHGPVT